MKSLHLKAMSSLALALAAGGVLATATPVVAETTTGTVEFTPGDLTVTKVPDFDFGSHTVSATDETYTATAAGTAEVTNLTGGFGASGDKLSSWHLSVSMSEFKANGKPLGGIQMSLENGTVANTNGDTVQTKNLVLTPYNGDIIFESKDAANGVSSVTWDANNIKLFVPGNVTKSATKYQATLTWTLVDVYEMDHN